MDEPDRPAGRAPARSRTESARTIGLLGIGAIVVVFAIVNLDDVKVDWIVTSSSTPLIVVIVLSFVLGLVTGLIGRRVRRARR
jgi:uncharacterized integral membrane protein